MPTFDSGRAASVGGFNIRQRRASDLGAIRFDANITTTPTSANDMLLYRRSSSLRFWDGTTEYNLLTSAVGSVGDLNGVYENGQAVTVDAGAIVLTDPTTGALDTLRITTSGAKSGDALEFLFTGASTGRGIYLDMDQAIAARAIHIDSGGTARTGADIQFTDDSTGNHSVLDINSSGSGATIGFDFVGSYAGSPAGSAISIVFDNSANLDTNGILLSGGTGVRTAPLINIDDAGTGSADIIDVDLTGVYTGDVFDFASSAAATGNVFFVNLDNAVAMTALHVEGSGVRTQPYVELSSDATGSAVYIDINVDGAGSGNVLDIVTSTTFTGSLINLDLNASTGGVAITINGSNEARTANLVAITHDGSGAGDFMEIADSNTSTGHVFDINSSGVGSGNILDITYSAADTGNAINVVMADNVAGAAINITGAGARTDNLIEVTTSETGSVDGIMLMTVSGVFTGSVLTLTTSGAATTGSLVHLNLDAGVAYKALTIDHAGARTVETILVTFDGTFGSGAGGTFLNADITMTGAAASDFIDIDVTGLYTGNIIDIAFSSAASTGDAVQIDMGTNLAGAALLIAAAGARTDDLIQIDDSSTGSANIVDINVSGVYTGNVLDITFSAAATGEAISVVMADNVAGSAILLTAAGARTDDLIKIDDSSTGNSHIFDINISGVYTGNVLDIVFSAAATGEAIHVDMATAVAGSAFVLDAAGTRTDDLIKIDDTSTSNSHVFDINLTGVSTGNVLDIVYATGAATGHAIHVDMGTDLAGNAMLIDAAGIRTAPLIYIANTGTDGGTDDHVLFVNQTGLLDSNLIQLTFATAASTGSALSIAMGTAVAGQAIYVSSAGTGTSGEGVVLDVSHTGALVAGADAVRLLSTGSPSATSNVLAVEQTTGAGTAGAYAVYISATGANVEALKVDDGTATFDEAVTVTGQLNYTTLNDGTTSLAATATELNRWNDVSGRLVAGGSALTVTIAHEGRLIALDTASGTTITLPDATGSGAIYRFLVTVTATSNSHIIQVANATDEMRGFVIQDSDTATAPNIWWAADNDDTITLNRSTSGLAAQGEYFELVDATSDHWFVRGYSQASGTEITPFSNAVS